MEAASVGIAVAVGVGGGTVGVAEGAIGCSVAVAAGEAGSGKVDVAVGGIAVLVGVEIGGAVQALNISNSPIKMVTLDFIENRDVILSSLCLPGILSTRSTSDPDRAL